MENAAAVAEDVSFNNTIDPSYIHIYMGIVGTASEWQYKQDVDISDQLILIDKREKWDIRGRAL